MKRLMMCAALIGMASAVAPAAAAKFKFPPQLHQTYCLDERDMHGNETFDVACPKDLTQVEWLKIDAGGYRGNEFSCTIVRGKVIPRVDYADNPRVSYSTDVLAIDASCRDSHGKWKETRHFSFGKGERIAIILNPTIKSTQKKP